jgi:endonuclease/exonuclease/phosphatase family metal-dependent hydrolase
MGKISKTISHMGVLSTAASGFAAFSALVKKEKFFEHNYVAPMSAIAPYSAPVGAATLASAGLLAANKQYRLAALAAVTGAVALHAGQYKVVNRLPKTKSSIFLDKNDIRVYVHNILTTNKDQGKKLAKQIELANPDIVVIVEANYYSIRETHKVLKNYLHQQWVHLGEESNSDELNKKFDGIFIASKFPIRKFEVLHECGRAAISCDLVVAGKPVSFIATHMSAPVTKRWGGQWVKELNALHKYIAEESWRNPHLIVVGDFNATMSHAPFRRLVKENNLVNVSKDAPTWPTIKIMSKMPLARPVLGLDHILVSKNIFPVRIQTAESTGSDHLPLIADLRVL